MVTTKKQTDGQNGKLMWLAGGILLLLLGMATAWKWTPLAELVNVNQITAWALSIRNSPALPVIILSAYLIGSLLLIPITALIIATALVFGPLLGSVYSFAGCFLGAAATYAVGYYLGRDLVRRLTGSRWARVERQICRGGLIAVATMRLLPVAPFTAVNVIAGAFQVPFRQYVLGSLLGLAPGIFLINLFAYQMDDAVRNPGMGSFALVAALVVISGLGIWQLRRRLSKHNLNQTASP